MSTSELPRINIPARSADLMPFLPTLEQRGNGAPTWTAEAPEKVVQHFLAGDEQQACRAWKRHLARRKSPWKGALLETFNPAEVVQWGCSREQVDDKTRTAVNSLFANSQSPDETQQSALADMLTDSINNLDERASLLYLACAYALPALSATVPDGLWWELLGALYHAARDAAALDLASGPLLHQWLAGELPLALATLFPELSLCVELRSAGRRALAVGLHDLLDGEGMPHWRYLDVQWPLVACWTRVRSMTGSPECWDDEAEAQYRFVLREMLRLSDHDGSSLFETSPIDDDRKTRKLLAAAVKQSGDKGNRAALQSLRWKASTTPKGSATKHAPSAANHSEWAQVAVLRPAWKRSSTRLVIAYGDRVMHGELAHGRDRLFTGDWRFTVSVDGHEATPVGDWESNCWVSDDDVDYLELEIALGDGLKLQRQLCLARKDRFLFIADAVLGGEARPLRHSIRLPLGLDVKAALDDETREVRLRAPRTEALVFPLSLPEWRVERRIGELCAGPRHLELQQEITAANLYAPLWIDLDPDRGRKPFTWRQLTVAEERRIVSRDAAVGYRVQFGKKQWLIYRSLTPQRNRTLLGHNLATDFLIARFRRDGSVKSLIEVE